MSLEDESFVFPNNLVKAEMMKTSELGNNNVNTNNPAQPVLHLSLESLSQMQELYYSYSKVVSRRKYYLERLNRCGHGN